MMTMLMMLMMLLLLASTSVTVPAASDACSGHDTLHL
jgi:hypothetical protein